MNYDEVHDAFGVLSDILFTERDLLRAGRASDAAALVGEKMQAMQTVEPLLREDSLAGLSVDLREEVKQIVEIAQENAIHFEAIKNGLRSAIDRLETMNTAAYVGSYGQDGSRVAFTGATGQFRKKV